MLSAYPLPSGNLSIEPTAHASESRANASSPPPINWATKPKPSQHSSIHSQDNTDEPSAPARRLVLVPVYIDTDCIGDFQELLRHLGGSVCQQPKPVLQDNAVIEACSVEEVFARFNQLEVNSGRSQQKSEDTRLRVDGCNPATQVARTDSPSLPGLSSPIATRTPPIITPQVSPTKKRYYIVLVGKCAGIYYEDW